MIQKNLMTMKTSKDTTSKDIDKADKIIQVTKTITTKNLKL